MKRSRRNALDILTLAPLVATSRLARLSMQPYSVSSFFAWQRLAVEKWMSACEVGLGAAHAVIAGSLVAADAQERLARALADPVARRVRANARGIAKRRKR